MVGMKPVKEEPPCIARNQSPEKIFSTAKRGVAVASSSDGEGSAFVVRHQEGKTLLLTNAHVVEGNAEVQVKWADGSIDNAKVAAQADGATPSTDLALLSVDGIRGEALRLSTEPLAVGMDVFVIGSPKGLEFSLSRGVVSGLRDGEKILQLDAAINPGNSGGPVLDASNCVVGVATFKLKNSESLNFAVTAKVIRDFLANPPFPQVAQAPSPPVLPPPDLPPVPIPRPPEPQVAVESEDSTASTGSNCFFKSYKRQEGEERSCVLKNSINSNGHTVYNLKWDDGYKSDYVFWKDGTVQIFSTDGNGDPDVDTGKFNVLANGVEVLSSEGSITFIPRLEPSVN
jgi:hypothetical protein